MNLSVDLSVIQKKIEDILPFWFGLLFFFGQISTALKSIPLVMVVLSIFLLPNVRAKFVQVLKTQWCQAAIFFFFVVLFACFWGPAPTAKKLSVLKQYNKLLYLPILAIGLSYPRNRQWALIGFFCAMVCTAVLSIGAYLGVLKGANIHYDNVFLNHIMTGLVMAFAAILALFYACNTKTKLKALYFSLFALFSFQVLFINLGRTGYVMYALMLGLFIVMYLPWKKCLLAILALSGFLVIAFTFSPGMHGGVTEAVSNYRHYNHNKNTSVGYRVQFHHYAIDLFKRHPWLGNGTGSFPVLFAAENPVPKFGTFINEPHGMYWFMLSEFGLVGFIALLWFFVSIFLEIRTLQSMFIPAVIFVVSFMVVNLSDSLLFYSASGYLFILFSALFLGEKLSTMCGAFDSKQEILTDYAPRIGAS